MNKEATMKIKVLFALTLTLALLAMSCPDDKGGSTSQGTPENARLEAQPPKEDIAGLFDTSNGFPASLSNTWKIWGHRNTLITHGFGADPTATVHNGRLYVYASNDSLMYKDDGTVDTMSYAYGIQGIRVISSADLSNWTDHGIINIAGPKSTNPLIDEPRLVTYAHSSWAPTVVQKVVNGRLKFFMYWGNAAGGNPTSTPGGIGVISANSPTGPWTSPRKNLLIDRNTPNCGPNEPNYLFDPGAMVDDDSDQGYIFFGGGPKPDNTYPPDTGQGRRAVLGPDMISLDGDPETTNTPYLFEDHEIVKIKSRYYHSYSVHQSPGSSGLASGQIAYRISTESPMGRFGDPVGMMAMANSQLATDDNNNHHCLFEFNNDVYIVYHASRVKAAMGLTGNVNGVDITGGRYRSPQLDKVTINASTGAISPITMTRKGVDPVGKLDPYILNEAETMANQGGIYTRSDANAGNKMLVTAIDTGDWLGLYNVDFGSEGAKKFTVRVRTPSTPANYVGAIELRLDPTADGITGDTANLSATNTTRIKDGRVIGRVYIKAKAGDEGKYGTVTIDLDETVTGEHSLVFVFYSSLGPKPIIHRSASTKENFKESHHKNGFEFDQWQFIK